MPASKKQVPHNQPHKVPGTSYLKIVCTKCNGSGHLPWVRPNYCTTTRAGQWCDACDGQSPGDKGPYCDVCKGNGKTDPPMSQREKMDKEQAVELARFIFEQKRKRLRTEKVCSCMQTPPECDQINPPDEDYICAVHNPPWEYF